jgi:hypothetical protein
MTLSAAIRHRRDALAVAAPIAAEALDAALDLPEGTLAQLLAELEGLPAGPYL